VLLRTKCSYGRHISAAAETQAVCLLLKPVQPNEYGAIGVRCILYSIFSMQLAGDNSEYCIERRTFSLCRIQLVYIYV
jgi:hypothetical protein